MSMVSSIGGLWQISGQRLYKNNTNCQAKRNRGLAPIGDDMIWKHV